MQITLFILGFVLFVGLIVIHEYGHYRAARRGGVKVEEFGIGFPPRAWRKKLKSGMILSLNWLPIGGFVRLKGEHDADKTPGSFGAASLKVKTKIMLAGVTMNAIAGLVILTGLAIFGMPKLLDKSVTGEDQFTVASDTKVLHSFVVIGQVLPGSPAAKAGLNSRDYIRSISNGRETRAIKTIGDLHKATRDFAGQKVQLEIQNSGKTGHKSAQLLSKSAVEASQKTDEPKGHLGVLPYDLQVNRSTWSAPIVAAGFTVQLIKLTFVGIGHSLAGLGSAIAGLVTGNSTARVNGQAKASAQVGGPVAIMAVLWGSGELGINFILMIIAVISLTLALMNILPIPALDGGRLFVTWLFRLLRQPLSSATEDKIHGTGMAILLGLFALITIVDVKRFF